MIGFEHVRAQRGSRVVLHDVTFDVSRGETVALVGRSGAGKSTVLKLINRMLEPCRAAACAWTAAIHVSGIPTSLRRQTGYVLQEVGLFPHMTVARNVGLVPALVAAGRASGSRRARTSCSTWSVCRRTSSPAAGPTSCRAASGSASAWRARSRPIRRSLLMDEPFGALDPITRAELHREFRRIQQRVRKTVVLVTHDMREAFALADRVGVLDDGHAGRATTTPAVLRASTASGGRAAARILPMSELLAFWSSHAAELWALIAQHIALVLVSTLVAVAVGVPIGIVAARRPRIGGPLAAAASIIQTIPSLALFGFLLPLPLVGGIGARTALVALILYALLPIIRTTAAGLRSIDRRDSRGRRRDGDDGRRSG